MDKIKLKNEIEKIRSKNINTPFGLTFNGRGIATDGILSDEMYDKGLKILILAKEPRGDKDSAIDFDFSEKIEEMVNGRFKSTWTNVYKMIKEIYKYALENNVIDSLNGINLENNIEIIKTLAWVNIKKTYGNSETNNKEFELYVSNADYRNLIKNQIISINPEYIIACGETYNWLMTYLMVNIFNMNRDDMYRGLPDKYPIEKGWVESIVINNKVVPVIATKHFARTNACAIQYLVGNFKIALKIDRLEGEISKN